jgi:hypothetical protein
MVAIFRPGSKKEELKRLADKKSGKNAGQFMLSVQKLLTKVQDELEVAKSVVEYIKSFSAKNGAILLPRMNIQ